MFYLSLARTRMTATTARITFRELLDYTAAETERWERWLASDPSLLDLHCGGEERTATVRGLLQHIFAVERRYADRLLGEPVTPYEAIPTDSVQALFDAGREARAALERYLDAATDEQLARPLEFRTITAGMQKGSARKIVAHALLHGIRHWAQLATIMRQSGKATDWMHDLLVSNAMS